MTVCLALKFSFYILFLGDVIDIGSAANILCSCSSFRDYFTDSFLVSEGIYLSLHGCFYIIFSSVSMVPIQPVDSVLLFWKVFSNFTFEYFFNFIIFVFFKDTNYAGFRSPLCSISIIFFLVLSTLSISIDCCC